MISVVTVPNLGVNDTTAMLTERLVASGDIVSAGTALCTLETTKIALDLVAEADGIIAWMIDDGATVPVEAAVALICPDAAELAAEVVRRSELRRRDEASAAGPRLTARARALLLEHGLDETALANHPGLVRETDVVALIARRSAPSGQ